MHLAQGHLDEEIAVEGVLNEEERMTVIENAASSKEEITSFKKELTHLKKKKTGLSQANTAAKAEVLVTEKEVGHCSKPVRKGLESILAKEWNIKRPSWHGDDILGNECRKLMAWARLVHNQMKAFPLEKMVEDGASERAKKEVTKRCDIVAKCLLSFEGFLSVSRTDHKDLTPELIAKAREHATKALAVSRMLKLSVTPKCHGSEHHAADQLEFPQGPVDFCEDWVEQLDAAVGFHLKLKQDPKVPVREAMLLVVFFKSDAVDRTIQQRVSRIKDSQSGSQGRPPSFETIGHGNRRHHQQRNLVTCVRII
jgi:hypothetical protein